MDKRDIELLKAVEVDRLKQTINDPMDEMAFKQAMEVVDKLTELEKVRHEEKANKKARIMEGVKVGLTIVGGLLVVGANYICSSKYAEKLYSMERGDDGVIFTGLAAKGLSDMNRFSRK